MKYRLDLKNKFHFSLAGKTFSNVDEQLKDYFGRHEGIYYCKACGKTEKSHSNMRYHVESKHYSPGYSCQNCGKHFQIKTFLQRHLKFCFIKQ